MLDLIIKGGRVVTPQGAEVMDVGIQGEKIVAVGWPGTLASEAAQVIDAAGKIVVPGGIEPHAQSASRSPSTGRALPMSSPNRRRRRPAPPPSAASPPSSTSPGTLELEPAKAVRRESMLEVLEARRTMFKGHSYTDFAFHYILAGEVPPATIGQIGEAVQEGVASFKIFTTFRPIRVPYGHLWSIFAEVAKHGGIMAVHAEEDDVVTFMTEKLKAEGRAQGYNLHLVHNNISEDLAFRHMIRLAGHTGVAVYFVHTTAKEGVAAVAEARAHGQPVYGEALHHYLHFTCEDYKKPGGTAIHTYPAIKFADDRDALIAGLMDGRLATTATDEYTTHKAYKMHGDTIETVCGGHNGIETRLPVAFTKFVAERNLPLTRFVDITSANAARILGCYPQKGAIQPGSDADLVLIDPALRKTIHLADLHADSDYSIWDGFECKGYPVMTILRGKVIVDNGALVGKSDAGRWLRRRVAGDVLGRPAV